MVKIGNDYLNWVDGWAEYQKMKAKKELKLSVFKIAIGITWFVLAFMTIYIAIVFVMAQ